LTLILLYDQTIIPQSGEQAGVIQGIQCCSWNNFSCIQSFKLDNNGS